MKQTKQGGNFLKRQANRLAIGVTLAPLGMSSAMASQGIEAGVTALTGVAASVLGAAAIIVGVRFAFVSVKLGKKVVSMAG